MRKIDEIYNIVKEMEKDKLQGVSAIDVSGVIGLTRSNVSRYLNQLYKENKLIKISGRPVLYKTPNYKEERNSRNLEFKENNDGFNKMAGAKQSLSLPIEKAKSAIMYPPKGLHTLILGETGVGKSLFAEQMYNFAIKSRILDKSAPFIRFNCADYVDNPGLLTAQIFGVKKGAFTGADRDRDGLLRQADKGILFLDEIHRLPPQGQEMLFTYIDNGVFRPLGDTGELISVDVRIIAATTENPNSYLLQTFSRRIPMIIKLPSLDERCLQERYSLINAFLKEESHRIGTSIYINKNSIISYLLYDCPNNIGQLKSDIQLACAKAFLNYKSTQDNFLIINQRDIPNHVRKGMLKINEFRKEIDELLLNTSDILQFSTKEEMPLQLIYEQENINDDFYDTIEQKMKNLKNLGMSESEINEILNIDIESQFRKYIGAISRKVRREELLNIVNKTVLETVEEVLLLAKKVLDREYSERIYFGLSLHLERSIERIRKGEKIFNPKLNFIRINHEREFLFAMKVAKIIDTKFDVETPVDEIGYLAMFFAQESLESSVQEQSKVKIIVAMHGKSTASSMVEVVNSLIGEEYIIGIDMPLTMKPQIMYEITKSMIKEVHQGKGIILMVDMGSLTNFGHMISEETGIDVRTIDMVSTLEVLDLGRKAIMGYSLDEIMSYTMKSLNKKLEYNNSIKIDNLSSELDVKRDVFITACFTGDGSAKKIADILVKKIDLQSIDIIPINIIHERTLAERIGEMKTKYNILGIISPMDIKYPGIPYISAIDIFTREGEEILLDIIQEEEMYKKIGDSIREHLNHVNGSRLIYDVKELIKVLEVELDRHISMDVQMGIALHICFLIDNLIEGNSPRVFEDLNKFKMDYRSEMAVVKKCFGSLEIDNKVSLGDSEIAYIVKLFIENNISVQ
ncbi:MAG: sigma 54-interacting transcriptional regulator [Tissierellaceae bacterium]